MKNSTDRLTSAAQRTNGPRLSRTTFETSRELDFLTKKDLVAQTGHRPAAWPLVVLKELLDNAMDACEEVGVAPEISVEMDKGGITVADNGRGKSAALIEAEDYEDDQEDLDDEHDE